MKKNILLNLICLFLVLSCSRKPVFKAFDGKFKTSKNNKIINDYCTSCHQHNTFIPNEHVGKVSLNYKDTSLKKPYECRTCHYLKKTIIWGDIIEKTRHPNTLENKHKQTKHNDYKEN